MTATAPLRTSKRRSLGGPARGLGRRPLAIEPQPIVGPPHVPRANSIFNSAIVPFGDGYAGVFRVDDTSRAMSLHTGRSAEGIAWEIDPVPIASSPPTSACRRSSFDTFSQLDNAFLPFNRNGVLFPRRIGGRYAMLSRSRDDGHTPFGDIYFSESPDRVHWGRPRHMLATVPRPSGPDELKSGWLATPIDAPPALPNVRPNRSRSLRARRRSRPRGTR